VINIIKVTPLVDSIIKKSFLLIEKKGEGNIPPSPKFLTN
jgi:hypothetical protein